MSQTGLIKKKSDLLALVKTLVAEKEEKFGDVSAESPVGDEEKELTNKIARTWSEVNKIVRKIRQARKEDSSG